MPRLFLLGLVENQCILYVHDNQSQHGSLRPLTFRLCAWINLGLDYQYSPTVSPMVNCQDMVLLITYRVLDHPPLFLYQPVSVHREVVFLIVPIVVVKRLGLLPHFP